MDTNYADMTREELQEALKVASDRLCDVEETTNFTLATTNTHHAASIVLEFEQDLYEHRDIVASIEQHLKKLS